MNKKQEVRKIDINSWDAKRIKKLEAQISTELNKIFNKANKEANDIVNIYDLEVVLSYNIRKIQENDKQQA